jgi:hypothetical protein
MANDPPKYVVSIIRYIRTLAPFDLQRGRRVEPEEPVPTSNQLLAIPGVYDRRDPARRSTYGHCQSPRRA